MGEISCAIKVDGDWTKKNKALNRQLGEDIKDLETKIRKMNKFRKQRKKSDRDIVEMHKKAILRQSKQVQKTELLKYTLKRAIQKQLKEHGMTFREYLKLRKELFGLLEKQMIPLWSAFGSDDYLLARYKVFGSPRIFCRLGPDYSIIQAASKNGFKFKDKFGEVSNGEKLHTAFEAARQNGNLISKGIYGNVVKVNFGGIDMRVKQYFLTELIKQCRCTLDCGPGEVISCTLLNRIDDSSPNRLPIPYIAKNLRPVTCSGRENSRNAHWKFATESGYSLRQSDHNGDPREQPYDKQLWEWQKETEKIRKTNPDWTLNNISPLEKKRKKQFAQLFLGMIHAHLRNFALMDVQLDNVACGEHDGVAKWVHHPQTMPFHKSDKSEKMLCNHYGAGLQSCRSPEAEFLCDNRKFDAEKNDVYNMAVMMFILLFNMDPYETPHNVDKLFPYITQGYYLRKDEWESRQQNIEKQLQRGKNHKRNHIRDVDSDGIVDFSNGITKVLQIKSKNGKLPRDLMITEMGKEVLHLGFLPEKLRPTAVELFMHPYFDDVRDQCIEYLESWQRKNFGECDDWKKILTKRFQMDCEERREAQKEDTRNALHFEKEEWLQSRQDLYNEATKRKAEGNVRAMHTDGLYLVRDNGSILMIHPGPWSKSCGFCVCGKNRAICLTTDGVYSFLIKSGYWKQLKSGIWKGARGFIYIDNSKAMYLRGKSIFRMCTNTGSVELVQSEFIEANAVRAMCYIGDHQALCLHKTGLYLIHTLDAKTEKLNDDDWDQATALCYVGNGIALCLHDNGVFTIDTQSGLRKQISKKGWPRARSLIYCGNGRALCADKAGLYFINTQNGSETLLSGNEESNWDDNRGLIWVKEEKQFRIFNGEIPPDGWELMEKAKAKECREDIVREISVWACCGLADDWKISGLGYGGQISRRGLVEDLYQIVCVPEEKKESGKPPKP